MKVTEVRIKLTGETDDRLLAFCSVTLDDCFVIRDLKIIDGSSGPFVAMPSRKLTAHCPRCRGKNHLRSNYCTQCGADLRQEAVFQPRDNSRLYADIAHPINAECRELIQSRVIEEFEKEQELAQLPGYRSRYDDEYDLLAGESDESSDVADESSPASGRERTGKSQAGRSQSKRRDGGKAVPRKRSSDQERHRSDPPESSGLSGPHQSPHQPEQSSKPDDPDDQFGAGIL